MLKRAATSMPRTSSYGFGFIIIGKSLIIIGVGVELFVHPGPAFIRFLVGLFLAPLDHSVEGPPLAGQACFLCRDGAGIMIVGSLRMRGHGFVRFLSRSASFETALGLGMGWGLVPTFFPFLYYLFFLKVDKCSYYH